MNRIAIAALCAVAFFWTTLALAHDVVLLRPESASPATDELLARLNGELSSVGFNVIAAIAPRPLEGAESTAREELRRIVSSADAEAIVEVLADGGAAKIRVFIVDASRGHELSALAFSPEEGSPNQLAIRASEVLRSRLLEVDLARRPARPAARAAKPSAPPRVENRRPRVGIELGAAALVGFDEVGLALAPLVRLNFRLPSLLVLQATAAGFGTRPTITTSTGSARVAQQFALLGARTQSRRGGLIEPFAAVSTGVLRTGVEGFAEAGGEGRSPSQWSLLLDAGLGASLELGRRYALTLETHLQLAEPYVRIHFLDRAVASSGRPNLVMTLALGAWP